ncbi:putative serine/threonine-protein kinase PBL7 [Drosera capensis]
MKTSTMLIPADSFRNITTGNHNRSRHLFHSMPPKHSEDVHSSASTFLVILPVTLVIQLLVIVAVLIAIAVLIVIILRLKRNEGNVFSMKNPDINDGMLIAGATMNLNEKPDTQSQHPLGGSSRKMLQRKKRGAQVFTYQELEIATDGFSETNVIGNDGFGVVYKGVLRDGTIAAIKMMHMVGKQRERAFVIEVDLLSRLHSSYLLELLGYCADKHHRLLVFEFMPNGSLQEHLHCRNIYPRPLDWGARLRIALHCARALEYLHEHASPSIIHRNFQCSNILLDEKFRAKVSDFSLAKIGSDKMSGPISTCLQGTTGCLAPEYVSTGRLTTKSDVYSYGVVLLQLITGQVPFDIKRPLGEHALVSWALPRLTDKEKVLKMVDPALKGEYSEKDIIQELS